MTKGKVMKSSILVMRHAEGLPNCQSVVVPDPRHGIEGYWLSKPGIKQVNRFLLLRRDELKRIDIIFHLDFARTRETAELIACSINVPCNANKRLRERSFGEFEMADARNYQKVRQEDAVHDDANVVRSQSKDRVDTKLTNGQEYMFD